MLTESEENDNWVQVPGTGEVYPSGTRLVPDPNNPRGVVVLPPESSNEAEGLEGDNGGEVDASSEQFANGTTIIVDEDPRGVVNSMASTESEAAEPDVTDDDEEEEDEDEERLRLIDRLRAAWQ